MTRLRGRAPCGQRLVASCPHGHWQTTTMISSVRVDGSSACLTIEGPHRHRGVPGLRWRSACADLVPRRSGRAG
ncbi:MAG: hypothetical protein IPL39_17890 [Opitutaceae bacterium]|nr:hypothetical protein [Opitutaceae bacterium]